jgi:hypothetical protein
MESAGGPVITQLRMVFELRIMSFFLRRILHHMGASCITSGEFIDFASVLDEA